MEVILYCKGVCVARGFESITNSKANCVIREQKKINKK
jgi:hypothetical protein